MANLELTRAAKILTGNPRLDGETSLPVERQIVALKSARVLRGKGGRRPPVCTYCPMWASCQGFSSTYCV